MKKLVLIAAWAAMSLPAQAAPAAQHSRAVQQISKAGFRDCAGAMDLVLKSLHDDDEAYSFISNWSLDQANNSLATTLAVQQFEGMRTVETFSAVKNAAGRCDVAMTGVYPVLDETCGQLRSTSFKEWKRNDEMGDLEIYEDPERLSTVTMSPLGLNGCLLVRHLVGYDVEP